MGSGIGGHHSGGFTTETWLTPPHVLAALGTFDLDPCAAPSPRPWATALRHIELPQDGLAEPWIGRVWMNPPYGRETARWLARLADHGQGTALVFARTETAMFFSEVWGKADAILFLLGSEIDYETTRLASRFVFRNPNETDACGCGESVTIVPVAAD